MNADGDFAVETRGLSRRFGRRWAVRDLDLRVPRGAVYGFLGRNGAGKSTTMRMLMGLLTPHAGDMSVLGLDPRRDEIEVKRRVGYVAEKPYFYDWMTVAEVMAFVAHYRPKEWDAEHAEELLRRFGLPKDQKIKTLSKGQQAKVSLLLALAFNPSLLILDEPTGGLDPAARREFIEKLLGEYMEEGNTVLISSHLINEISGLVDWVGILNDGRLAHSEPAEQLLARVKRARLVFESDPPGEFKVTGLFKAERNGRAALLLIENFDPERSPNEIRATGAKNFEIEDLSLENVFIELTSAEGGDAP